MPICVCVDVIGGSQQALSTVITVRNSLYNVCTLQVNALSSKKACVDDDAVSDHMGGLSP